MSDACLFCRIARGDLPAHRVYEDDQILAFLDLHPIRPGHCLIIPKEHHPFFEDLPEALATRITTCAQRLARYMKVLYPVRRVALFYTGIHVAHAHAHVVPMHHEHDVSSQAYLRDGVLDFAIVPQLAADEGAAISDALAAAFGG
ncbi:HIT family protein [uncultured Paracoccus sp.]|uniref:HIT family protein n=1 Tax=uncultured Paracoccus sp. TaxID=189685 RepID=UPI002594765A|nr:HIT family protein [uncultured Paracoccus sp.]